MNSAAALNLPNGIPRHKTAIRRSGLSSPVRCLLRDGLLDKSRTLFDYGCGRGMDLSLLRELDIPCDGWDPVYRANTDQTSADVVNLGYVINVIENGTERSEVLKSAWALARSVLAVAAQLYVAAPDKEQTPFTDGVLTSRGTFQKYYTQTELRAYLEDTLATEAVPAAPGIFYLFKDDEARHEFLAKRYRRTLALPTRRVSEVLFEQNQDVLDPFLQALTRLGRLPDCEEFLEYPLLIERFGTAKRALSLVNRVIGAEAWIKIAERRAEDLLVYLALSRFGRRPSFAALPISTQRDTKAFFGSYPKACTEADALLLKIGNSTAIDEACRLSAVGRLVDNALLVHRAALPETGPLLRIYEGCARALAGDMEETDVVKLHRFSGKVSYLAYENFEEQEQPLLRFRVKVTLPLLAVDVFDHTRGPVPARLDSKEGLISNNPDQIG